MTTHDGRLLTAEPAGATHANSSRQTPTTAPDATPLICATIAADRTPRLRLSATIAAWSDQDHSYRLHDEGDANANQANYRRRRCHGRRCCGGRDRRVSEERDTEVGPCTLAIFAQGPPANGRGIQFGKVNCPRPYGRGVHFDTYTVTPTGPGHGTLTVRFKNYFDRGLSSGTAALTFAATSPTNITYTEDVTITGGTGAFKHLTASEKIQCTTTDGGAHKSCTVNPATPGP